MEKLLAAEGTLDEKINALLDEMSAPAATADAMDPAAKTFIDGIVKQDLSERERLILIRHFGLDGDEPVALEILAAQLGERVSALAGNLEQILGKMRQAMLAVAAPNTGVVL